jgi:hypothetical protein
MQIEKERAEFVEFAQKYYKLALHEDYDFVHKSTQRYINVNFFHLIFLFKSDAFDLKFAGNLRFFAKKNQQNDGFDLF